MQIHVHTPPRWKGRGSTRKLVSYTILVLVTCSCFLVVYVTYCNALQRKGVYTCCQCNIIRNYFITGCTFPVKRVTTVCIQHKFLSKNVLLCVHIRHTCHMCNRTLRREYFLCTSLVSNTCTGVQYWFSFLSGVVEN